MNETAVINDNLQKFYFTFGSDGRFPFRNTYLIVLAEDERQAVEKFRAKYPDRGDGFVNCSFWYPEKRWHGSLNEKAYGEPAEIIM